MTYKCEEPARQYPHSECSKAARYYIKVQIDYFYVCKRHATSNTTTTNKPVAI
jgi:hypothetical protein